MQVSYALPMLVQLWGLPLTQFGIWSPLPLAPPLPPAFTDTHLDLLTVKAVILHPYCIEIVILS